MEINIGKYIPNDTIIHRIDPRIKLFSNILLIVFVFLTRSYITFILLFIPLITVHLISGLTIKKLFFMFKPVIFISLFLFVINIFIIDPKIISAKERVHWFESIIFWKITLSADALNRTLIISIRIYLMIIVTTLITSTTKPIDLTRGIEDLMSPLKLIKFPVHIIAMIISIALRFIPTLLEESQRIMKAQASRGVDFKNGNIKTKIKSLTTLIIPLFVTSFDKAFDLSNAMEVRGYDPYAKRTRYRNYSIKWIDVFVILKLSLFLIIIIFIRTDVIEVNKIWWWY